MRASEAARSGPLARPVLTLTALLALAVLLGLGVWQVQRLQWKRDLIARVEAVRTSPARPLPDLLTEQSNGVDVDYARAVTDCPGLDRAPFLRLYGLQGGAAGHRYISACPVEGGPYTAVLVDRGFLPDAEEARMPAPGGETPPHRPVVGVLRVPDKPSFVAPADRPAENLWHRRDVATMGRALGVTGPVAPVFLFLESPAPAGFGPQPAPVPTEISNRHLGYAITWFGLAAALVGVYGALLRRGRT